MELIKLNVLVYLTLDLLEKCGIFFHLDHEVDQDGRLNSPVVCGAW